MNYMYDEDNVDLEEQLYLQDVQDEIENPEHENIYEGDYDLTRDFLDSQINLKDSDKLEFSVCFKKNNKIFVGKVIGKSSTDKDKYVFNMGEYIDGKVGDKKTKIFNFRDIKKY